MGAPAAPPPRRDVGDESDVSDEGQQCRSDLTPANCDWQPRTCLALAFIIYVTVVTFITASAAR
jgi:hypothetical protein